MALGFPTRRVREGLVELLVPDVPQGPGPGARSALPFYNPAMAVARGVTGAVAVGATPPARRRSLADVRHTDAYAEVDTRLLLGSVVRIEALFDKGVEPVLAYAAEHF